jgi:DNA adenine methylase
MNVRNNLKPLLKWSGGKSREIPLFKNYYPIKFSTYIEPFVGGGSVFFDLNFKGLNVINDIHKDLINFYNQIKLGHSYEIYKLMQQYKNDEKIYYYIRDEFTPSNDIEKAFVFYYLRKTCFRGMLRYNQSGKFNVPFGRYKTLNYEILKSTSYENLFNKTEILSVPFEEIFEKYNDNDTFIFLDPPYDSIFTDYGYCIFDKNEQQKLFECFSKTKSKCLLIIGETDYIKELYKDYIKSSYDKKYAFKIHSGRIGSEIDNKHLIITNY